MRCLLMAALCFMAIARSQPALAQLRIALSCGAVAIEFRLCAEGAQAWARQTGHHVELVSTPSGASERLALYQQLLAARSDAIDVLQVDVVWPGLLGRHLLDLSDHVAADMRAAFHPAIIANNTVGGRLVAMPWFTSAGLLYYRRDLLEQYGRRVPQTWRELSETARIVMEAEREEGRRRVWGFVFQGRAYEGLTVNALEWVASHGGGTIVAPDGRVTVNNPRAIAALDEAASWIGRVTPIGVLNYAEEEARGVFQTGNAVFMRNWPYAWPLLNAADSPVRGRVGVTVLPRGEPDGRHAAALGGENLAVSRYSRHPAEAASLVRFLTSRSEQKRRAVIGGMNPTIGDLYDDPQVLTANPFFASLRATFETAVARPAGPTGGRYNQVSAEFRNSVHAVLSGRRDAASALARLERNLLRIGRDGRW